MEKEVFMEQLQQLEKLLKMTTDQVELLRISADVKQYFELVTQEYQLLDQIAQLQRKQQMNRYAACNHIWVVTYVLQYPNCNTPINYHGCIKCGLDQSVLLYPEEDKPLLTQEAMAMYDFLSNHDWDISDHLNENLNLPSSLHTFEHCNIDLGRTIYAKIKKAHPTIDDLTALHYFKVALHHIKATPVNQDRETKRMERLSMGEEFSKQDLYQPLKRKIYVRPELRRNNLI